MIMETMKAIPFYVGDSKKAVRHIFIKPDLSNECALSIANIPPIMSMENVESLLNSLLAPTEILRLTVKKSTALNGDLSEGYRLGSVHFCHINDCKTFLKKCTKLEPISLEQIGVNLPSMGIKKMIDNYVSKFVSIEELLRSANDVLVAYEEKKTNETETAKRKFNEPDDEGWVTVTKLAKHSFRGKINYRDNVAPSDEPKEKKLK